MNKEEAKIKYKELIVKCSSENYIINDDDYCEIHHIEPRSEGGSNESVNLIKLKYSDHILAHYYLAHIYNDDKMLSAFNIMICEDKLNKILPEESELIIHLPDYDKLRRQWKQSLQNPVYQYDLDGNFIAEYDSCKAAALSTGLSSKSIVCCACGYTNKVYNTVWSHTKVDKIQTNIFDLKKAVYQYDLDGNFIAEYESQESAAKATGIDKRNISAVCNGKRKTTGGFIWKAVYPDKKYGNACRKDPYYIYQYDLDGNIINIYKSITDASRQTNISYSVITTCLSKQNKSAGGFIWRKGEININYTIPSSKAVNMYDLDGKYIRSFISAGQAHKETNISIGNICSVCNRESNAAENYQWRWECDYPDHKDIEKYIPYVKKIYQYDLDGNFIAEYDNAADAKRKTGIDVHAAIQGKNKTAGGFIWKDFKSSDKIIIEELK